MPGRHRFVARLAVAGLAVPLAACSSTGAGPRSAGLHLTPCAVQMHKARCGTLLVPENRLSGTGRKIGIRVVVVPAEQQHPSADAVVPLAGGPGGAATDLIDSYLRSYGVLNRSRDFVFVDQRGTGGSNPLTCPAASAGVDLNKQSQLTAWVQHCLRTIDGDARLYTTAMAMDDVAGVLQALGYRRADVIAGSYGATAAQVLAQRHPTLVRTMTLIGGTLLSRPIFELVARNSQTALDDVFSRCARDPACRVAFPQLRAQWRRLLERLDVQPVVVPAGRAPNHQQIVFDRAALAAGIHDLLLSASNAAEIPAVVHVLATSNDPAGALAVLARRFSTAADSGGTDRLVMAMTIRCSEAWAAYDPRAVERSSGSSYYLSVQLAAARAQERLCTAWPTSAAAADNRPLLPLPQKVLMLNGGADPQDPPANMAGAVRVWAAARQIVLPHQGHQVDLGSCGPDLIAQFVQTADVAHLDTTCVQAIPVPAIDTSTSWAPGGH